MNKRKAIIILSVMLLSLLLSACAADGGVTGSTEADGATQAPESDTVPKETPAAETGQDETTAAITPGTLTMADLEGLDGRAALEKLMQNGLQLGEYYANNKNDADKAVAQILLDLKEGRTDPMMYSFTALIELHRSIKEFLGVPDRLQLWDVQNLAEEKGEKLSWGDFEDYEYEDIGSGVYIRQYPVGPTNEYMLLIRGADTSASPEEMCLYLLGDGKCDIETDEHIDIRREDVNEFIGAAQ